ncbi:MULTISPECIES: YsgD/CorL family protein [Erwiniaceae]
MDTPSRCWLDYLVNRNNI